MDGYNLCMTGNCVDDHLDRGVLIEKTYGSVLSGNMIEECHGAGVTLDRDCYGITISANVIAHNGEGVNLVDAHGCAVSANTFTVNKRHGLHIGEKSGRITVTGNNFSNSFLGEGRIVARPGDRDAGGLVLKSTAHISLTGNVFSGLTTEPIKLEGTSSDVTESANVIVADPPTADE
jgi:parallel beta-helix repeat protein